VSEGSLGSSTLELRTDSTSFNAGLDAAAKRLGDFDSRAVSWFARLGVLKMGWDLVGGAISGVTGWIGSFIEHANEQEDAVVSLNAALQASAKFTTEDSTALQDYATALQDTTRYGDEAVMVVQRLLVQFGAGRENINRMTKSVLDLSAGLGIDLETAARIMARAIQGNTDLLGRYGIVVDQTAQKQKLLDQEMSDLEAVLGKGAVQAIRDYADAMVDVSRGYGNTAQKAAEADAQLAKIGDDFNDEVRQAAEKYANSQVKIAQAHEAGAGSASKLDQALKAIEGHYGGQAQAQATTFAGVWAQVRNAWGDLLEVIGGVITNSPTLKGILDGLIEGFRDWTKWVKDNADQVGAWVDKALKAAVGAAKALADAMVDLGQRVKSFDSGAMSATFKTIGALLDDLTRKVEGPAVQIERIGNTWTNVKAKIEGAGIKPTVDTEGTAGAWEALKTRMIELFKEGGKAAGKAFVEGLWEAEKEGWGKIWDWTKAALTGDLWKTGGKEAATQFVESYGQAQKTAFEQSQAVRDAGTTAGEQMTAKILEAVQSKVPDPSIWEAIGGNAARRMWDGFVALTTPSTLTQAGQTAGQGILDGIWLSVQSGFATLWAKIRALFSSSPVEVPIHPMASGSPTLPFTEYFLDYAPKILAEFARAPQDLIFGTNTSQLGRLLGGNITAFQPALSLLAQGSSASADALRQAIEAVDKWAAPFKGYQADAMWRNQDPFNLMGARGVPTVEQLLQGSERIREALENLLVQNQMDALTAERQANAAEATSRYSATIAGSLSSSVLGSTVARAVESGVRAATGNRAYAL
jgi:hypothetical protein